MSREPNKQGTAVCKAGKLSELGTSGSQVGGDIGYG